MTFKQISLSDNWMLKAKIIKTYCEFYNNSNTCRYTIYKTIAQSLGEGSWMYTVGRF